MRAKNEEHLGVLTSGNDWEGWKGQALLVWGIFNPNGPTLNVVGIRERAGGGDGEVFHRWLHFTRSETRILGSVNLQSEDVGAVFAEVVRDGFAAEGTERLLTAVPAFILAALPDTLDGIFRDAIRSAVVVQESNWGREMDLLRRYGDRLFDRAREEVGETLKRLRADGVDPTYLALLEARYSHLAVERQATPGESLSASFDPDLFEAWWATVKDERFAASGLYQTAQAWVGAIHQVAGSVSVAHSFESVRDLMEEYEFPLWPADLSSVGLARSLGLPELGPVPEPLQFAGESRFPLSDVASFLQSQGAQIEAMTQGFTWWPQKSSQATFAVVPLDLPTDDGYLITEQAEWVLRAPWMRDVDDSTANAWNRFAAVAGFARSPGSGELVLASKVGIHEGDGAAALRNYAPIMAMGAAALGWIAERYARSDFLVSPKHCPFEGVEDPPPVSHDEFAAVLESHIKPLGLLGSIGNESITAEFPWDAGAMTHMARLPDFRSRLKRVLGFSDSDVRTASGRTALIWIRSNAHHPWFGRGVQATLELPLSVDDPTVIELVRDLNTWELETPDLPPFFGAWVVGPRAPMFQTFVPNQFCIPGLVMNLASWSIARAGHVRRWLGADSERNGGPPSASA